MKRLKYLLILVLFVSLFYSVPISFAKFRAVKSLEGTIVVPENNYCLNNNINTLSDCMLVMDNYSDSVSSAKTAIQAKGTPDFSKIAPQVSYRESGFQVNNASVAAKNFYYVSDSYSFDSSTGLFNLTNPERTVADENHTSYVGKYTCGTTNSTDCINIYLISEDNNDGSSYVITNSTINTAEVYEVFDSDNGLYSALDDLGTTYYYRGNVKNNFVKYDDIYWRIIRRNGDGSVRLRYFSALDTSQGESMTTSKYNEKTYDLTYAGFMYNENDFSATDIISSEVPFIEYDNSVSYYFAKSYTFDTSTNTYNLNGTIANGDIFFGKWSENYETILNDGYYYSCFGYGLSCSVLKKINSYQSSSILRANYISRSNTSYENVVKNNTKSAIMQKLELWYDNHLSGLTDANGDLYSDYLSDAYFCNDRSFGSRIHSGSDGFSLSKYTDFGSYLRITSNSPSFNCPNVGDTFTMSTSSYGNKKLLYPVGLVTADELVFAGAVNQIYNPLFYMNYGDNKSFWTMSPSYYTPERDYVFAWHFYDKGILQPWNNVANTMGIHPVVNLKSSVKITGGDGTASNPYQLSLQ